MDKDQNNMTEMIINLTLEIIFLLSGEDYTVKKKTSNGRVTPSSKYHISGGLSRIQSPIPVPPPHSLIHERHNDQKILELNNKIIHLLTGEVWQHVYRKKEYYKDVTAAEDQTMGSLGLPRSSHTLCPTEVCHGNTLQALEMEGFFCCFVFL
ncbi:oocyte zinc finger protein XlCOF29-like isoform X2 [Pseudophryne corroboree]|uniref:oocyte zinc finger protein XlCOF29-like isoform X2 n=1 Tax=Pseudophryne corroboree TaxID=495146 RepID=UPI003081635D